MNLDLDIIDQIVKAWPRVAGPWTPPRVDFGDGVERWPWCRLNLDGHTVVWDRTGFHQDRPQLRLVGDGVELVEIHAVAFGRRVECQSRKMADEILRSEGWLLLETPLASPREIVASLAAEIRESRNALNAIWDSTK